ncbi:NTP transferase domain-containing protein [Glutamicibacter halophytocola]|uniref:acylneuraminate cytidylyltransferase family protein n=1 Tax=Glutamicibacter halophytocola TaxID=1933880 RepID=UPI00321B4802
MSKTNQPHVMAIIPARGGSKGIRLKNLREIGGKSPLGRAIESAKAASTVSDVVVSTDHEQIKAEALRYGARVVDRPADIAGDTASSESVLQRRSGQHAARAGGDTLHPVHQPADRSSGSGCGRHHGRLRKS